MIEGTGEEKTEKAREVCLALLRGHHEAEEVDVFCMVQAVKLNQALASIFSLLLYGIIPTTI